MSPDAARFPRTLAIAGGWSLIVATGLFAGVFTYLAGTFDYPMILERPASEVLPRLLALGGTGRAVWTIYGMIPWLLVPTALGVDAATRHVMPRVARAAPLLAGLAAACMSIGLLRWPFVNWSLALALDGAAPVDQAGIAAAFVATNDYLGRVVGEFLGELFLNGFLLCATIALRARGGRAGRWLGPVALGGYAVGTVAMFRNVTSLVSPVATANNLLLPLWMLVVGLTLVSTPPDLPEASCPPT